MSHARSQNAASQGATAVADRAVPMPPRRRRRLLASLAVGLVGATLVTARSLRPKPLPSLPVFPFEMVDTWSAAVRPELVGSPADAIVRQVIAAHRDATNPLDPRQPAYVSVPPHTLSPGQVSIRVTGAREVTLYQIPAPGDLPRQFRIGVE